MIKVNTLFVIALLLAACQPAAVETSEPIARDRAAVREAFNQLRGAYKTAAEAGDAPAIAALYAEDAILMPVSGGRYEGRAEIEASYQAIFDQGDVVFEADPRSFELDAELAVEDGRVTFSVAPEGAERQDVVVDYLVVTKEIDGELKIYRMMSKPAGPPPGM